MPNNSSKNYQNKFKSKILLIKETNSTNFRDMIQLAKRHILELDTVRIVEIQTTYSMLNAGNLNFDWKVSGFY